MKIEHVGAVLLQPFPWVLVKVRTDDGHVGIGTRNTQRNDLARSFQHPDFHHFATDIEGRRFITDYTPDHPGTARIWAAEFGDPLKDPLTQWRYLLDTRTLAESPQHAHPFLSPDGRMAFFNARESGNLQAYMVKNIEPA